MNIEFKKCAVFLINITNAILWIMIALVFVLWLEQFSDYPFRGISNSHTMSAIIAVPVLLLVREPLFQIKKIIYNMMNEDIFIEENIKRFKRISYPLFILSIATLFSPFAIIQLRIGGFSLRVECFIFIILGFLSLLMAHIFAHAMQIQTQSLELQEETKLTI